MSEDDLPEPWAKVIARCDGKNGRLELRRTPKGNFTLTRFAEIWPIGLQPSETVILNHDEAQVIAAALIENQ